MAGIKGSPKSAVVSHDERVRQELENRYVEALSEFEEEPFTWVDKISILLFVIMLVLLVAVPSYLIYECSEVSPGRVVLDACLR
jgi:uncharacterized ion transporter superfamily protein YfcC